MEGIVAVQITSFVAFWMVLKTADTRVKFPVSEHEQLLTISSPVADRGQTSDPVALTVQSRRKYENASAASDAGVLMSLTTPAAATRTSVVGALVSQVLIQVAVAGIDVGKLMVSGLVPGVPSALYGV